MGAAEETLGVSGMSMGKLVSRHVPREDAAAIRSGRPIGLIVRHPVHEDSEQADTGAIGDHERLARFAGNRPQCDEPCFRQHTVDKLNARERVCREDVP